MPGPLELEDLYPVLREPRWEGTADTVWFPLAEGLPAEATLVVALAFVQPGALRFLSVHDEAQRGFTREQAVRLALDHIAARPAAWYPGSLAEGPPVAQGVAAPSRVTLLAWEGDTLAAEKLLDPAFMKEAHARLGTRRLAVGLPCRGLLLVTDGNRPVVELDAFARRVAWHYRFDERRGVSHHVLFHERRLLRGGVISGVFADSDAALKAISELPPPVPGAQADPGSGAGALSPPFSGSVLLQLREMRREEDPRGHTLRLRLASTTWEGVRAFMEAFAVATFETAGRPQHRPRLLQFEVDASLLPADTASFGVVMGLRSDIDQLLYRLWLDAGGEGPATCCEVGWYQPANG